jgi:hypothetical protein
MAAGTQNPYAIALGNPRVLVVGTGFRKRSCSTKRLERGDDSQRSHPTLARVCIMTLVRPIARALS